MQNKFQNPELTAEQQNLYNTIIALQSLIESATLNTAEMSQYTDMTYAKKKKLVSEIYFKDKKRKEFYACKDGRYKSYNPQFIAPSEKELVQKLYDYYFNNTLEDIYKQWVQHRAETQIVSQKTIEEDIGIWNRFIADTELARMQIAEIKPVHVMKLFQIWTGNGKITRKDFNNRKSVLNGIFRHAVLNEIITFSPITDLPCNTLKFKLPNASKKAYTVEERAMLLSYLRTLEQDAYTLAIQFAFYGIFRVGEIKGLTWDTKNENIITIKQQLVEERTLQEDMTFWVMPVCITKRKDRDFPIFSYYLWDFLLHILNMIKDIPIKESHIITFVSSPVFTFGVRLLLSPDGSSETGGVFVVIGGIDSFLNLGSAVTFQMI